MCKQIDHFPEDADYEADASEYFLRESSSTSSTFKSNAKVWLFGSLLHTLLAKLHTGDHILFNVEKKVSHKHYKSGGKGS